MSKSKPKPTPKSAAKPAAKKKPTPKKPAAIPKELHPRLPLDRSHPLLGPVFDLAPMIGCGVPELSDRARTLVVDLISGTYLVAALAKQMDDLRAEARRFLRETGSKWPGAKPGA